MKIIHVITSMQKAAGTSVFCAEVCNGLVVAGHDVTIAVVNPFSSDRYPLNPQINLIGIDSLFNSAPLYDVIHIHALWAPILHKVSNWAHKNNISVVWSPHGMLTPWAMNNKKWKKRFGWWLYQGRDLAKAELLHVTAQSEVDDVKRMGLRNKFIVAPLGVSLPILTEKRRGADKILLFVSRIQRKKGLVHLVKAWAMLPSQERIGWKVRIVGPDQEGHTAELKKLAVELEVNDRVEFVGPKYGEELQNEYADADLFVLPTYSENFGSVVVEALAHALPVITTKGTPWHELESRRCGWWIDIGEEPLANVLQEAMALSEVDRQAMGERGRKLVEEKYTWSAVVKTMIDEYKEVLGGRA